MQPIFLISPPRAGSTFLQRMLSVHPDIASAAEPWILLPLVYSLRKHGSLSIYSSSTCTTAIEDFCNGLPHGEQTYWEHAARFANSLYHEHSGANHLYFLDKTPRYYLIVKDLLRMFPNAKFILLARNPLDTITSVLSTWGSNRLASYDWNAIDICESWKYLAEARNLLGDQCRYLRYEALVKNPELELRQLCDFLSISWHPAMLNNWSQVTLSGRLGDPNRNHGTQSVHDPKSNAWHEKTKTFVRKRWLLQMLNKIQMKDLATLGYDLTTIKQSVTNHKVRFSLLNNLQDIFDWARATARLRFKPQLWFKPPQHLRNRHLS